MILSVNLNKIALLRNSRGTDYPNLETFALQALEEGAEGITLHPRPDHRHATSNDVINLGKLVMAQGAEFNIEGNPFELRVGDYLGFEELVKIVQPTQATLVPDALDQITSDHGWETGDHDHELEKVIKNLKDNSERVSLFVDPDKKSIDYAQSLSANCVEIYTEAYARSFADKSISNSDLINTYKDIIIYCKDSNLRVNAGHDLNLDNLPPLRSLGLIDEVSIGHAIIVDSLKYGFRDTINRYINITKGQI